MKTAFVFPGQGSQYVGMGKDLYENFKEAKDIYAEASDTLKYDIAKLSFEGPDVELNRTFRTQPCLLTASIAAYKVLRSKGISPSVVAGHSLGEYSAIVSAGAIKFSDALRLTEMRGTIMQDAVPEGHGLMAAILGLERQTVDEICASVESGYVISANYNCPGQIVVSGEREAVEEAMRLAKEAGAKRTMPILVSVPSHCRLMDGAAKKLSEYLFLEDIAIKNPEIPVVSNSDAIFITTADGIKASLVRQLNNPVLWEDSVRAISASGVNIFVEAGPRKVLSGLIKRIAPDAIIVNVEDKNGVENAVKDLK